MNPWQWNRHGGCPPGDGWPGPAHLRWHARHRHWHARHRRRHKLFWRVYLHSFFLLLVVGLAVFGISAAFRNNTVWRNLPTRITDHLALRFPALRDDPAGLEALLRDYQTLSGMEASLYRLDGRLLATNIRPPVDPLPPARVGSLEEGPVSLRGIHWRFAAPVRVDGRTDAYLVATFPTATEYPYLRAAAVFAAVLMALAWASVPLARAIASPIERLTGVVRAFGAGDLSARTRMCPPGEVGELARAFDDMAERIQHLIRGEKELLANVSHELRTPMARIKFALELAADGDPEEARRYLREIGTDLVELEQLVEDVLATARFDLAAGRAGDGVPPLHRTRIEPRALVDQAADRFRSRHPGHTLALELAEDLPEIEVDPVLVRRVIDNLLDNASKYADPTQPILLAVQGAPDGVSFEVRDRGTGIAPEDLPHLFDPFYRTDRSRARGTGGVGLGLTLAKRIIEAHHGQIGVESTVGMGTTFRFTLPARTEELEAPSTREEKEAGA